MASVPIAQTARYGLKDMAELLYTQEEMGDLDLMRNVISVLLIHSSCTVYRIVMSTKCVVRSRDVGMSPAQGALLVFLISKLTHLIVSFSLASKKTKGRGKRKKIFLWCTLLSGISVLIQTVAVPAVGWYYIVWLFTVIVQCIVGAIVEVMSLDFFLSVMSEWVVDTIMRILSVYLAITVVAIGYVLHVLTFISCLKLCLYHTIVAYVSIGILYNEHNLYRDDQQYSGLMPMPSNKNILVYSVGILFLYCPVSIVITQLDLYMVEHLTKLLNDEKDAAITYLVIALASSIVILIAESRIKQMQSLAGVLIFIAMTLNCTYVGMKHLLKSADTAKVGYLFIMISFHVLEESLKRLLSICIDKETTDKTMVVQYSVKVLTDLQLIGMHTMIAFVGTIIFGILRSSSSEDLGTNPTFTVLETILKYTWTVIFPLYLTFILIYNMNFLVKDFRESKIGLVLTNFRPIKYIKIDSRFVNLLLIKPRGLIRRGKPKIYLPSGKVRDVVNVK